MNPAIDKAQVKIDKSLRSYAVHSDGKTYRVTSKRVEIKPRKFKAQYAIDLSRPYSPQS
jgi:hypothetical protein